MSTAIMCKATLYQLVFPAVNIFCLRVNDIM